MSDPADDSLRSEDAVHTEPTKGRPADPGAASNAGRRAGRGGLVLKLSIAFAATLLAMEAALLVSGHRYTREVLQNQINAHLSAVAASRRQMVEAGIKLLRQQVTLNTQRGEFRRVLAPDKPGEPAELDRTNSQKRLEKVVDGKSILVASLADSTGNVLVSSDPAEIGKNVAGDRAFSRGLVDSYLGLPLRVKGHSEATLAAPIRSRGTPVGVLLLTVDAAPLSDPLQDTSGLGKSGEVMLLVRDHDLIRFVFPPRLRDDISAVSLSATPVLGTLLSKDAMFLKMPDYRGQPVLAASNLTNYEGWSVVVKTDEAEAYAPIDHALRARVVAGAIVAVLGAAIVYILARGFAKPVRRLSEAASRVAEGNYESQVPVTSHDELGALSASFNDMTAAIRARGAERDRAEAALRLADRRKDDFLAVLGHELRNPVAAIDAGVLMWKEAAGDPATAKSIQDVIHRQTNNLKRLVDDLLDVARITTGKIELRRSPANVSDMIGHAVDAVRPMVEERCHHLDVSLPTGSPAWIDADSTRIEQVLANLLTNAAKYTPDGGRISIAERKEGDEVVIAINDNGIGLAPEVLAHIFDLFTQVDTSLHRTYGGLGIGLSLAKRLVELHGGTISARSDGLNCGAEFTIRLPTIAAPPPSETVPPIPSVKDRSRRILLVDDNKDSTTLLSQLLQRRGHRVRVAYDGKTGLSAAQDFKPDVLILDIGLPEIDGYELARRFRAEGFADSLIIALTGYAQEHDRARARDAGFDYHFAKPIDLDSLATLILSDRPAQSAIEVAQGS